MKNLKLNNTITVTRVDAKREIERLGKTIGKGFNFSASLWALEVLINAYNTAFEADYYAEEKD